MTFALLFHQVLNRMVRLDHVLLKIIIGVIVLSIVSEIVLDLPDVFLSKLLSNGLGSQRLKIVIEFVLVKQVALIVAKKLRVIIHKLLVCEIGIV